MVKNITVISKYHRNITSQTDKYITTCRIKKYFLNNSNKSTSQYVTKMITDKQYITDSIIYNLFSNIPLMGFSVQKSGSPKSATVHVFT